MHGDLHEALNQQTAKKRTNLAVQLIKDAEGSFQMVLCPSFTYDRIVVPSKSQKCSVHAPFWTDVDLSAVPTRNFSPFAPFPHSRPCLSFWPSIYKIMLHSNAWGSNTDNCTELLTSWLSSSSIISKWQRIPRSARSFWQYVITCKIRGTKLWDKKWYSSLSLKWKKHAKKTELHATNTKKTASATPCERASLTHKILLTPEHFVQSRHHKVISGLKFELVVQNCASVGPNATFTLVWPLVITSNTTRKQHLGLFFRVAGFPIPLIDLMPNVQHKDEVRIQVILLRRYLSTEWNRECAEITFSPD